MAQYPRSSSQARSANMRANRRTGTKPELALRRALHGLGYRYRKDYRIDLDGRRVRPDVVFTARRVAVFVDGCFWHACPEHGGRPAVNDWYWSPKLRRNVERDRSADETLAAGGWRVVRIWEHETLEAAVAAVVAAVGPTATGARARPAEAQPPPDTRRSPDIPPPPDARRSPDIPPPPDARPPGASTARLPSLSGRRPSRRSSGGTR